MKVFKPGSWIGFTEDGALVVFKDNAEMFGSIKTGMGSKIIIKRQAIEIPKEMAKLKSMIRKFRIAMEDLMTENIIQDYKMKECGGD